MRPGSLDEVTYLNGPRIMENGRNIDSDVVAGHPLVLEIDIADPVSNGSLGETVYAPGQLNKDGGLI